MMMINAGILFLALAADPATTNPTVRIAPPAPAARAAHPFTLRADVGWNSLSGLGLRGSWAATPHLALDAGTGYVLSGPKAGARVRWNFLTSDLTPYVALGGIWSAGRSDAQTVNRGADDEFTFHVGPAGYAQAVAGLDFQDASRFTYSFELGWAQPLGHRDLHVVSGTLTDTDWSEVRLVSAGGPVVGGSIGYAF